MSGLSTAELKRKMNKNNLNKNIILLLSVIIILSSIAFAIPNSLTLQGKLTTSAGVSVSGTNNFTFAIYDNTTAGNRLWELGNTSITTDANGVYDVILSNINLSFADQYYLGITVGTDAESSPRINLTSSPYSFRANVSEGLNANNSYFVNNLSVNGHLTIGNGTTSIEINTQSFNFSTVTGNLNINGTATAKYFVGDGSLLSNLPGTAGNPFNSSTTNVYFNDTNANLGLGLSNPSDRLVVIGNVRISGGLNASSINITGITLLGTNSGKAGVNITNPSQTLQVLGTFNVSASTSRASDLFVASSGNIGIGTSSPGQKLTIVLSSGETNPHAGVQAGLSIQNTNDTDGVFNSIAFLNSAGDWSAAIVAKHVEASGVYGGLARRGQLLFMTADPADGLIWTRMILDENSNLGVGISNSSPSARLQVAGSSTSNSVLAGLISGSSGTGLVVTNANNVGIGATVPNNTLYVAGTLNVTGNSMFDPVDSTLYVDATNNKVGIGTTSPTDSFTVIGSSVTYGSLNATSINATTILQGGNAILLSRDFNLGNISNYTQYATASNVRTNITDYLGGQNSSLVLASNLTTLNTLNNYIRTADFNLGNISNNSQFIKGSDFNLGNISNYTQYTTASNVRTNVSDYLGQRNSSIVDVTNNQSFFNQYAKSTDFNLNNISNYTQYATQANVRTNITDYLGGANGSIILSSNLTTLNTLNNYIRTADFNIGNISNNSQFIKGSDFNLGNISNNTLTKGDNATTGLWNVSGLSITPKDFDKLVRVGNLSADNISSVAYNIGWTNLSNYPSACPAGQFVQQVGDTLTCAAPSLSSAGGWTDDGILVRLSALTDTVSIGTNATGETLIVNGTFRVDNSSTPVFFVNSSALRVGIGTTTPTDTLTVIGSLVTYGSLNATSINATRILQGGLAVQVSGDFNLGNISNYTQYTRSSDFNLGNISNYTQYQVRADAFSILNLTNFFGDSGFNGSVLRVTNISNILLNTFQLSNFTLAIGNRNSSIPDVINNASFFNTFSKSGDFNLGNISNYTQYATQSNVRTNITDYLGNQNGSIILAGNLTTLDTLNNYIRTADFNLGNISNNSQFIKSSDFNLGNISNNTLVKGDNASLAFWNVTQQDFGKQFYLRDQNSTLLLGNLNTSMNFTDTLTVSGSAVYYGSLNATFINATRLLQGGNAVLLSKDFNLGNISNYTQYATQSNVRTNITDYLGGVNGSIILSTNSTFFNLFSRVVDSFNRINLSDFFGSDLDINNTLLRRTNTSFFNAFQKSVDFNLGNISNYTQYATQSNVRTNVTDYLGGQNSSLILASNLTTLDTLNNYLRSGDFNLGNISNYTQFIKSSDFNLGNISNNTLTKGDNATIGLWNVSGSNIFTGYNVGIGTTSPGQTLHVVGNANLTQQVTLANVTISRTVINTTQDNNQNLTISSAAGSVIIRLG
ncbi:MAG TPA: hypothetical protein VJJ52_03925 [Candidatus Nanoarchaeia archaeon]|nr:hypothetical protein [Candidatus Nanoarchaeia archaeon]